MRAMRALNPSSEVAMMSDVKRVKPKLTQQGVIRRETTDQIEFRGVLIGLYRVEWWHNGQLIAHGLYAKDRRSDYDDTFYFDDPADSLNSVRLCGKHARKLRFTSPMNDA